MQLTDARPAKLTANQEEAGRAMSICNACRYCEGLCAVFPAMEQRRVFDGTDVDYLANLCHGCGACYYDCQYAPPHEFAVNVPAAMAELREESYARFAWPSTAGSLFAKNALWTTLLLVLGVAVYVIGFVVWSDPGALFASGTEAGAFYRVMPHNTMVIVFSGAFLFGIAATCVSVVRFWRAAGPTPGLTFLSLWQACVDSTKLRYLDGGGMGCMNTDERPSDRRRFYHHLTFYGFLLCFASTTSGTISHYVFDWPAPYPWWSPTKILGVLGGLGLIAGPIGLFFEQRKRDPAMKPAKNTGLGETFIWILFLLGLTGMVLTALRSTPAMGIFLAIHLGVVFVFFVLMPYSKFVHGLYRYAALVRHAYEQRR